MKAFILIATLGLIAAIAHVMALWTDRNLEFWLSYFKEAPVEVPYWMSLVLSLVLNAFALAANVISEVIKLAI